MVFPNFRVDDIREMAGLVFSSVRTEDDLLVFENDDVRYIFHHIRDCCESVYIEDIIGDLSDLVGVPLLQADEVSGTENDTRPLNSWDASHTWTFYNFSTIKGSVTVRWYGTSNGYYSEAVHAEKELLS